MLVFFYIVVTLTLGWRHPGVLIPAAFYGFTAGAIGGWPQTTTVLVVLSIAMLAARALVQRAVLSVSAIDICFFVFIGWCCLSASWQPDSVTAPATAISFASATTSIYLLCRLVGGLGPLRDRILEMAMGFCVLGMLLTPMAFSAGSYVYGRLYIQSSPPVGLSQPVPYVALSALALLVSVKRHWLPMLFVSFFSLWAALAMGAGTGTRGAALAAAAGLLAYVAFSGELRARLTTLAMLAMVSAAALLFLDRSAELEHGLVGRLLNIDSYGSAQDLSSLARYDHYRFAWYLFEKNPLSGVGLGGYSTLSGYEYPHNLFLEVGATTGIVGLFLLCIVIAAVLGKLAILLRGPDRPQIALLTGLLAVAFVHQQVSFELAQAKGLFLIGLIGGAVTHGREAWSSTGRTLTP